MRDFVKLHINGRPTEARGADAFLTLSDLLRRRERLTGTKVVCAEGDCGACTVLVGRRVNGNLNYAPICSCIQLVGQLDDAHVVTVEGLSGQRDEVTERRRDGVVEATSSLRLSVSPSLSPLQHAMATHHGTQCGFCTPGFVVSMHHHLSSCGGACDAQSLRRAISGNLCRCTGYDSIVRAGLQTDPASIPSASTLYPDATIEADPEDVFVDAPGATFFKPVTLQAALDYKHRHPDAVIASGQTDYGVLVNKQALSPTKLLSLFGVEAIARVTVGGDYIDVGGAATLTALQDVARERFPELAEYLEWFGSPLIRNAGTLAGNLATASPIGDMTPVLMAMGAEVVAAGRMDHREHREEKAGMAGDTQSPADRAAVSSSDFLSVSSVPSVVPSSHAERVIPIDQFITGYRKTALRPDELIARIRIPLPRANEVVRFHKVSKRKDLDISTVSASFRATIDNGTVKQIAIAMGGVGPVVMRLPKTEALLVGQALTADIVRRAAQQAHDEITPIDDVRGSAAYRRTVARGLVERFAEEVAFSPSPGTPGEGRGEGRARLHFSEDPHPNPLPEYRERGPYVGRDLPHESACTHVTGQSIFLDDVAPLAGELVVGIVPSPVASGKLLKLDVSAAQRLPGVVSVITARDVGKHNRFGPVVHDEDLLVESDIAFLGQPLAIIGATSQAALDEARKLVTCEVEPGKPILSIDDAIAVQSYLGQPRHMSRGDLDAGFARAEQTINGTLDIGGQEHFYLESQIAIVVPGERGEMTVHSSTQHPSEVQMMVAEVLGVPFSKVTCICKRMGGGFGGKETQAAQPAMFAALVASRTGRPARFAYSKDDDMRFTGKRHPFKAVYRAGFTRDGELTALDLQLFSNGGCSTDLSFAVLERAMLHSDNAYFLPAVKIVGRVCKTNLPSNTAFRGFGGPQGVASIEHILQRIAHELKLDPLQVRSKNLYGEAPRNVTQYGQAVQNNTLPELFASIRKEADYDARRASIAQFNRGSPSHAKGIAVSPVKFGISFTRRAMNQANALVNVYQDGSAIVSTGATEMGQGVHTRIRQIVADELGIPFEQVVNTATSTDKNNNTSPTAASSGTDLNGAAAADACSRIRERLSHVAASLLKPKVPHVAGTPETCALGTTEPPTHRSPEYGRPVAPVDDIASRIRFAHGKAWDERDPARTITLREVCCAAYEQRVSMGERGFYATPGVDFNRETGQGTPFLYFTNGVACSEVTVDRRTGEMTVDRVDLIMDVGESINPGIDRGQIVGGFVQGMGWCTTEELKYDAKGKLLSYSPTTYKIPAATDVPIDVRVRFLDNPNNVVSLRRSKAVGEPPLMLGLSVWLAASDAVTNAGGKPLNALPATGERLRMSVPS